MAEPMAREAFDAQLRDILNTHGAASILGAAAQGACISVFTGGEALEAVAADDPRHRYGLTFDGPLEGLEAWIAEGEAYDDYVSMNICRFSCVIADEPDDPV